MIYSLEYRARHPPIIAQAAATGATIGAAANAVTAAVVGPWRVPTPATTVPVVDMTVGMAAEAKPCAARAMAEPTVDPTAEPTVRTLILDFVALITVAASPFPSIAEMRASARTPSWPTLSSQCSALWNSVPIRRAHTPPHSGLETPRTTRSWDTDHPRTLPHWGRGLDVQGGE